MDFISLECYCRVCELLNFSKAAEELYMTQPALSRRIVRLEDDLGIKLLNRTKTNVSLTLGGRIFYDEAVKILALEKKTRDMIRQFKRGKFGRVVVGVCSSNQLKILFDAYREMRQEYPEIEVSLVQLPYEELMQKYADGEVNVVYGYRCRLPRGGDTERETVLKNKVMVLVPKVHTLAEKTSLTCQDLVNEKFALPGRGVFWMEEIVDLMKKRGVTFRDILNCATSTERFFKVATGEYISLTGKFADENTEVVEGRFQVMEL